MQAVRQPTLEEFSEMRESLDAADYSAQYDYHFRPAGCNCAAGTVMEGHALVCQECGIPVDGS